MFVVYCSLCEIMIIRCEMYDEWSGGVGEIFLFGSGEEERRRVAK